MELVVIEWKQRTFVTLQHLTQASVKKIWNGRLLHPSYSLSFTCVLTIISKCVFQS